MSLMFLVAKPQTTINESSILLNINGGGEISYDLAGSTANPDFDGTDFGAFNCLNSLTLIGGENRVSHCIPCEIISCSLQYRIWRTDQGVSGSFISLNLPFNSNLGTGCDNNDQSWSVAGNAVNLAGDLASGNYTIEVYTQAAYDGCGEGTEFADNGGNYYTATFSVSPFATATTLFSESMGTAPSPVSINSHETSNGFDNDGFTISGNGSVRNATPSSGYAGVSGLANIFLTNTIGANFQIAGINTTNISSLVLSFGIQKNLTASTGADLALEVSTDGVTYAPLTFSLLPTGAGTTGWYKRTSVGTIPATSNLRIRFRQTGNVTRYRIDDMVLTGLLLQDPTIAVSGETQFCEGGSVTLTSSQAASYLWSNGETTQAIVVTETDNLTLVATDDLGCQLSPEEVSVFVVPIPTITNSGTDIFCENQPITLTASEGTEFSWIPNDEIDQFIEVTTSGTYSVIVDGCLSDELTVTALPISNGTIAGDATIIIEQSATLNFNFSGVPPFSYSYTDGTTVFGPFSTMSFTDSKIVTPAETTIYTLTSLEDNGDCAGNISGSATIVVELPTTKLASNYCGIFNYVTNNAIVSTQAVPSTGVIGYDFEFTELQSPFNVYTAVMPNGASPGILLYMFPQVKYNRTYSVRTRPHYQNQTANFGPACTIGLAAQPITSIASQFENGTFTYCSQINAIPVGGASQYRFTFTDGVNPVISFVRPNWALPLSFVPNLLLGTTYAVRVFTTVGGIEGDSSLAKNITMSNVIPNTGINQSIHPCGNTYSPNAVINAIDVCKASSYTWRFKNTTQVQADIIYTRPIGNRAIILNYPTGLIPGNSYNVDVKASAGGFNGQYGSVCNITIAGGNPGMVINDDVNSSSFNVAKLNSTIGSSIVSELYPNPNNGNQMGVQLSNLPSENQKIVINIFDISGKLIQAENFANNGSFANLVVTFKGKLPAGIYYSNIIVNNALVATEKISVIE
jgi:Secretion system C-terminal sorting domain